MTHHSTRSPWLPLLALSLILAAGTAGTAQAATVASLQVHFGTSPRWSTIPGTSVREIRGERPGYDMFRYGGGYYVYDNNQWYMSRRSRGEFRPIEERQVPAQFYYVPREHWRSYPAGWSDSDRGNRGHGRGHGQARGHSR